MCKHRRAGQETSGRSAQHHEDTEEEEEEGDF